MNFNGSQSSEVEKTESKNKEDYSSAVFYERRRSSSISSTPEPVSSDDWTLSSSSEGFSTSTTNLTVVLDNLSAVDATERNQDSQTHQKFEIDNTLTDSSQVYSTKQMTSEASDTFSSNRLKSRAQVLRSPETSTNVFMSSEEYDSSDEEQYDEILKKSNLYRTSIKEADDVLKDFHCIEDRQNANLVSTPLDTHLAEGHLCELSLLGKGNDESSVPPYVTSIDVKTPVSETMTEVSVVDTLETFKDVNTGSKTGFELISTQVFNVKSNFPSGNPTRTFSSEGLRKSTKNSNFCLSMLGDVSTSLSSLDDGGNVCNKSLEEDPVYKEFSDYLDKSSSSETKFTEKDLRSTNPQVLLTETKETLDQSNTLDASNSRVLNKYDSFIKSFECDADSKKSEEVEIMKEGLDDAFLYDSKGCYKLTDNANFESNCYPLTSITQKPEPTNSVAEPETTSKDDVSDSTNNNPVSETTNNNPVSETTNNNPVTENTSINPVSEATNNSPVSETTNINPVSETSKNVATSEIMDIDSVSETTKIDAVSETTNSNVVCEATKNDTISDPTSNNNVLKISKNANSLKLSFTLDMLKEERKLIETCESKLLSDIKQISSKRMQNNFQSSSSENAFRQHELTSDFQTHTDSQNESKVLTGNFTTFGKKIGDDIGYALPCESLGRFCAEDMEVNKCNKSKRTLPASVGPKSAAKECSFEGNVKNSTKKEMENHLEDMLPNKKRRIDADENVVDHSEKTQSQYLGDISKPSTSSACFQGVARTENCIEFIDKHIADKNKFKYATISEVHSNITHKDANTPAFHDKFNTITAECEGKINNETTEERDDETSIDSAIKEHTSMSSDTKTPIQLKPCRVVVQSLNKDVIKTFNCSEINKSSMDIDDEESMTSQNTPNMDTQLPALQDLFDVDKRIAQGVIKALSDQNHKSGANLTQIRKFLTQRRLVRVHSKLDHDVQQFLKSAEDVGIVKKTGLKYQLQSKVTSSKMKPATKRNKKVALRVETPISRRLEALRKRVVNTPPGIIKQLRNKPIVSAPGTPEGNINNREGTPIFKKLRSRVVKLKKNV